MSIEARVDQEDLEPIVDTAELPESELQQRTPVLLRLALARLETIPEFAIAPKLPTKRGGVLPSLWRREATWIRGINTFEASHEYWDDNLQNVDISRCNQVEEDSDEYLDICSDLQGRIESPGISASACLVQYYKIGNNNDVLGRNSNEGFRLFEAFMANLA